MISPKTRTNGAGGNPSEAASAQMAPGASEQTAQLKRTLLHDIRRSVYVYRVDCGGCNGCEIEIFAALTPIFDAERFGIKVVASPRHADVMVFTGAMTRAMRLPALRAYLAAPDPKICVAFGACGCSGGIFHDLYCVWGGADAILPIDVYIPGCPPTPAATLYGFAMALGLLAQKLKATHLPPGDQPPPLRAPHVPPELRVALEREARRMAGYWHGRQIADDYLGFLAAADPDAVARQLQAYVDQHGDPRLAEIMARLHDVYVHWRVGT